MSRREGEKRSRRANLSLEKSVDYFEDCRRIRELTPILQMVAMPVQLSVCTPGPKYSMMYPVPPCSLLDHRKFHPFR